MRGFIDTKKYTSLLGFNSESTMLKITIPLAVIEFGDYTVKVEMLNTLRACLRKKIRNALQSDKFRLALQRGKYKCAIDLAETKTFEDITFKIWKRHPDQRFIRPWLKFYELLECAIKHRDEIIFYNIDGLSDFEEMILREIKHGPKYTLEELINKFEKDEALQIVLNKLEKRGFISISEGNIIPKAKLTIVF